MGVKINPTGLTRNTYIKTNELVQWMKLTVLCGELDACAKETRDKEWRRYLKCSYGLLWKVINQRLECIDKKQYKALIRRREHSEITLVTSDEKRLPHDDFQENVTVAYQDLLDLADLASNSCCACPQGECVSGCFYRNVMHRLGLPVCRDNPKTGECEFSFATVGEVSQVKPRNQRNEHYFSEDYVV